MDTSTAINVDNLIFEKPSSLNHVKIEYIYNLFFNSFPSRLQIQDSLDLVKTLGFIQDNFKKFSVDYSFSSGELSQTGIWKGFGEYEDVVLEMNENRHNQFGDMLREVYGTEDTDSTKSENTSCRVCAASSSEEKLKKLCSNLSEYAAKKSSKIHKKKTSNK